MDGENMETDSIKIQELFIVKIVFQLAMDEILRLIHYLQVVNVVDIKSVVTYFSLSLFYSGFRLKSINNFTFVFISQHFEVFVKNHFNDVKCLIYFIDVVTLNISFLNE